MKELTPDEKRVAVRDNYAAVAKRDSGSCGCNPSSSCCDPSGESVDTDELSAALGYSPDDLTDIPSGANMGLGCGNPTAIAALKPGEIVLDLGSGGGFDSFLAVRQVGEKGRVIGVDMTPEMVDKARKNAAAGDFTNVDFRLGEIENLPVADNSVDVLISNCVINLSPDKARVFHETFRVLRAGGRILFSDIVAIQALPDNIRNDAAMISGCIGGAALVSEIEQMLSDAGFQDINVTVKPDSAEMVEGWMPGNNISDYVLSATIEAVKPTTP